jgi:hypothetical protein
MLTRFQNARWHKEHKSRFSFARGAIHSDGRSGVRGVGSRTMVNMSRLFNKVAIVTGASKGIGGGIATALGAAGARVAVNYSSDREGAETRRSGDHRQRGRGDRGRGRRVQGRRRRAAIQRSGFCVRKTGRLGQQRRGIPLRRFRGDHRRELSPPLRHQRSRGDSHRAGGDQAVRCRRREHHQPQLNRENILDDLTARLKSCPPNAVLASFVRWTVEGGCPYAAGVTLEPL